MMDNLGDGTKMNNWLKTFMPVWIGQIFSLLGSSLVQFSLVWWLTQKTGSAAVLATATLASMLPQIVLGPFSGALVDRWSRRIVMILADGSRPLAIIALAVLFWSGTVQVWHVYVVLFLRSIGSSFQFPAMQASTSLMVPDKHLARIAGINQGLQGAVNIIAPPAGAFLLGIVPFYGVISIDIIAALLAILPLCFIHVPQPVRGFLEKTITPRGLLQDVKMGVQYLASWPGLMAIVALAALMNFLSYPMFSLQPLLVTRHFHGGVAQLGTLESMFGIGVVAGGVIMGAWGGFKKKVVTAFCGLILGSAGSLILGLAPTAYFAIALGANMVSGLTSPIVNGTFFALLQSRIAPEVQGRVFTLVNSLTNILAPISMLIAAPVADNFGITSWYIMGGAISMLIGVAAFFIPTIMHIEDMQPIPLKETG
jgi:MFS transporter, DHA3 family, macrolide efflux protein